MDSSDDEIRKKYGVASDTPIIHEMPSKADIVRERSFLEKLSGSFGAQEWMWKTLTGRILAIVIVTPAVFSAADWWATKIDVGLEIASPYLAAAIETALTPSETILVFSDQGAGDPLPHSKQSLIIPRDMEPLQGSLMPTLYRAMRADYWHAHMGILEPEYQTLIANVENRFKDPTGAAVKLLNLVAKPQVADTVWANAGDPIAYFALERLGAIEAMVYQARRFASANAVMLSKSYKFVVVEVELQGVFQTLPPGVEAGMAGKQYVRQWLSEEESDALIVPSSRIQGGRYSLLRAVPDTSSKLWLKSVSSASVTV